MRTIVAVIGIVFGAFGWVGQTISTVNYPLAQRFGLQEADEGTDPLFRRAEANAARWDAIVLWTLPVAGVAMLVDHPWWPWLALIAGGIYLDGAGRESAKYVSLSAEGVRIGTPRDNRTSVAFFTTMFLVAVLVIGYALWFLAVG